MLNVRCLLCRVPRYWYYVCHDSVRTYRAVFFFHRGFVVFILRPLLALIVLTFTSTPAPLVVVVSILGWFRRDIHFDDDRVLRVVMISWSVGHFVDRD